MSIKEIPIIFNDRARGTSKMSKKVILEAIYMVPLLKFKKYLNYYDIKYHNSQLQYITFYKSNY